MNSRDLIDAMIKAYYSLPDSGGTIRVRWFQLKLRHLRDRLRYTDSPELRAWMRETELRLNEALRKPFDIS